MARISVTRKADDAIPKDDMEKLTTCVFCGKTHLIHGGCWSGNVNDEIGVCGNCVNTLVDLLIDTLDDSAHLKEFSREEQIKYITNIVENRIIKKDSIDRANAERTKKYEKNL